MILALLCRLALPTALSLSAGLARTVALLFDSACRLRWHGCLIALALLATMHPAGAAELTPAADLREEARVARQGGYPLVILFSRRDCTYCEAVRREYLLPMLKNPAYRDRLIVRQVNQDSEAGLVDFAGQKTTHAAFAQREKIKLVPVVAFFDERGRPVAEPIVGKRIPDFYFSYLEAALNGAGAPPGK